MSEIVLGDIVARLRVDSTAFTQALQDAQQRLTQLNQAFAQLRQQQTTSQQATQQSTQAWQALTQAITANTQAITQANSATTQFRQQQNQLQSSLQQTREAARASGSALQTAFAVAGGIGIASGIGGLVGKLKDFAVSVVDVGTRVEQLKATLSAISGSTAAGAQQFQFITDVANRLGVGLFSLADGFRQLSGATRGTVLAGAETQKIFEAVATASRAMGSSQQQVEHALLAIGQTISKGTVPMEELRGQLAEALPGAVQIAARALGVTTERLNDMVAAGEVRAIPFVRALTDQLRYEFGPAALQAANTAASAFGRLGNQILELKNVIAQSGILAALKEMAEVAAAYIKVYTDAAKARKLLADTEKEAAFIGTNIKPSQVTTQQGEELKRLRDLQQTTAQRLETMPDTDVLRAGTEEQLRIYQEQEQTLLEQMRTTIGIREEKAKGDAAEKERVFNRRQEADALDALKTKLKELSTLQENLRKGTVVSPETFGDPKGTADQQATFAKEGQKRVQELQESILGIAKTVPLPVFQELLKNFPEVAAGIKGLDTLTAGYGKTVEDLKEKEREEARVKREALADQKRAVTEAIQLDAALARVRAFQRRSTESPAEEARSRVQVQGAEIGKVLEQEQLRLQQSASLQALRPGGLAEVQQLREALPVATAAEAEQAFTKVLQDQLKPLEALGESYRLVSQEQAELIKITKDLAAAQDLWLKQVGGPFEQQAEANVAAVEKELVVQTNLLALRKRLNAEALASAPAGREAIAQQANVRTLEEQLAQLQTPRDERLSARLRRQAERGGQVLSPEQEGLLRQIQEQERLNQIMDVAGRIGDQMSQTLTTGLLSVVSGTEKVSDAFRAMARSILDSIAQIVMNESFRMLIGIGLGALRTALSPTTASAPFSMAAADAISGGVAFQHGGVVNRPTMAMIGENPAMNPEYVLNRPQMQALMRGATAAGPSAGGQSMGGITIINTPNPAAAEREAAQQRALGRRAVINYIMEDLGQGSGSQIGRLIKLGQQ